MSNSEFNAALTRPTSSATLRIRRYRTKHRRIDYAPSPDVLAIIQHHLKEGFDSSIAGILDELIRRGHKSVSGNGGK
jgi:hypothetical protein